MAALITANLLTMPIEFAPLPGGRIPVRGHDGLDVGLDCFVRAIVSTVPDKKNPKMRTTITDLTERKAKKRWNNDEFRELYRQHIGFDENGAYWRLEQRQSVSIGLGFNVDIPFGLGGFLYPRGSNIVKNDQKINLAVLNKNPIDPGFDGEPWLEVRNDGDNIFKIYHHARLAQLVIMPVSIGRPRHVKSILGGSRGHGSNGSTGH